MDRAPFTYRAGRILILIIILVFSFPVASFAQTDSFDVFIYKPPESFTKKSLPSRLQFHKTKDDSLSCTITLYKSMSAKGDSSKHLMDSWNKLVVKTLSGADKKPGKIMTGQTLDGWESILAIGNFYNKKKKCVVMLNMCRKGNVIACIVFAIGDRSFMGEVEMFSNDIHLIGK